MALELYRAVECLAHEGPEPRQPVLSVEIREPLFQRVERLTAPLDTGFAGYILVSQDLYDRFGTAELPKSEFGVYRTMAGPITLKRARVIIGIQEQTLESYIEAPLFGVGKLLVGRRVLQQLDLGLFGRKGLCCALRKVRSP